MELLLPQLITHPFPLSNLSNKSSCLLFARPLLRLPIVAIFLQHDVSAVSNERGRADVFVDVPRNDHTIVQCFSLRLVGSSCSEPKSFFRCVFVTVDSTIGVLKEIVINAEKKVAVYR